MKGRPLTRSSYIDGTEVASRELSFIQRSKLLSSKGCDIVEYSKGERDSRFSLTPDEQAFYKSLPEWNEAAL